MQEELAGLATKYPDQFKVYYVLNEVSFLIMHMSYCVFKIFFYETSCVSLLNWCVSSCCQMVPQPPEQWDGGIGFVSKEMIQNHCPAPAPDVKVIFLFHLLFSGYISTEVMILILWFSSCINYWKETCIYIVSYRFMYICCEEKKYPCQNGLYQLDQSQPNFSCLYYVWSCDTILPKK